VKRARSAGPTVRPHLRLVSPPDLHARPSLAVGDLVVYASHGIGRIESTQPADGLLPERIILVFERGLRVTLPLARARDTLRCLCAESELADVRTTLRAAASPSVEPWSRRHRLAQEKLAAGRVDGLAELVRDGLQRERRLASAPGSRPIAPTEDLLYRQARKLLAAEIAASRGIEADDADAWILQQVCGDHP
jgi:RNA polymerase-interacting CarD/CdnL/TRCF family regulator